MKNIHTDKSYSILIVDDHPLVGDGISSMLKLSMHYHIIGYCRSGEEAFEILKNIKPDIILLDINLPDISGLELCESIRNQSAEIKLIGLTSTNEVGIISQFLARGGNGYLLKSIDKEELLLALEEVLDGRIYLAKMANQKLLSQFRSVKNSIESTPILTRREKTILVCLNDGLNGPEIASKLYLSPFTVETHRKNLLQKFKVNSTPKLLLSAKNYGLL
jgi:DNA-binding NarL/FixJ family response regulator